MAAGPVPVRRRGERLLLAALPMLGLLRRRRCRWDWLLPLASLEILAGLYFLVNPTLLGTVMDLSSFWGLAAACGAGATLAAWVVLRGLERLEHASCAWPCGSAPRCW